MVVYADDGREAKVCKTSAPISVYEDVFLSIKLRQEQITSHCDYVPLSDLHAQPGTYAYTSNHPRRR